MFPCCTRTTDMERNVSALLVALDGVPHATQILLYHILGKPLLERGPARQRLGSLHFLERY
jgi:hypothetical protein